MDKTFDASVRIVCPTIADAAQVLTERCDFEEELGFNYTIEPYGLHERVYPEPLEENPVPCRDQYGRELLTVSALKKLLDDLPGGTHVVIDDGAGWYVNVEAVGVPNEDDEAFQCLTLFRGAPFDSRQF